MAAARVTLIDDDVAFVTLVMRRLVQYGYAVDAQFTAAHGLRSIENQLPDAVITDVRLGTDDGWALAASVKRTHPALPVVIVTAYPTLEMHEAARRWQLPVFIKPFDVDDLVGYLYLKVPPS